MESVLVTGADGFVGRHVVAALRLRGVRVLAAPRAATDLLDPAGRRALIEAERPEGLIHLAWVTEHGKFWSSAENVSWRKASGDLFDLFFAAGGRRAVGAGSCAEYDWSGETARIREDAPLAPHSIYGKAKAETAEALMTTAARHGGSAAWGRLFFLFGAGEPPGRLIPSMIRAARNGAPLDCAPAETSRDFWDVRNAGAAFAALVLPDVEGPVNIASGRLASFGEIGGMIESLCHASSAFRFGARPLGSGEPVILGADTNRLKDEVGFVETTSLEQGLADLCEARAIP